MSSSHTNTNFPEVTLFPVSRALREVPAEEFEEVVLQVVRLGIKDVTSFNKAQLINTVSTLKRSTREVVVDQVLRLVTDRTLNSTKNALLKLFDKNRPESTEATIDVMFKILQISNKEEYEIGSEVLDLIKNLLLFEKSELEDFVTHASRLTSVFRYADVYSRIHLITTAVISFSYGSFESTVNSVLKLASSNNDEHPDTVCATLQTMTNFESDVERDEMIEIVSGLLAEDAPLEKKLDLVDTIFCIDKSDRSAVVDIVHELLTEDTDSRGKIKLVKEVSKVPTSERCAMVDILVKLSMEGMRGGDKARIIKEISQVPPSERDVVVDIISRLLVARDESGKCKARLVKSISNVPSSEREDVFTIVFEFIFGEANWNHCRSCFVDSVAAILPQDRSTTIGILRKFTAVGARINSPLINTLNWIRGQAKEAAAELVLRLLPGRTDLAVGITMCVFAAPSRERVARVDRVIEDRELHHGDISFQRIEQILQTPIHRPVPERGAVVPDPDLPDGVDVHVGDRDERTRSAIGLLLTQQSNLPEQGIAEAYSTFREFLETLPSENNVDRVRLALDNADGELGFGGLSDATSVLGIDGLTGANFVGRLWVFATDYNGGVEEVNIHEAILGALSDSIEDDGHVVCDPGKVQRLVRAVLQGRLAGVDLDGLEDLLRLSESEVSTIFFTEARRQMTDPEVLRGEIDGFLAANPRVDRVVLVNLVEGYISNSLL